MKCGGFSRARPLVETTRQRKSEWGRAACKCVNYAGWCLYIQQTLHTILGRNSVKQMGCRPCNPSRAFRVTLPAPDRLRLVYYPDPVLSRVCADVTEFGPQLRALALRMLELMREHNGVGLAAPQVGVAIRLFVCNSTGDPADNLICVNPRLKDLHGAEEKEEGCLSITGVTVMVRRALEVTLEAQSLSGESFSRKGRDLEARIWQHEVDHTHGRLIIDAMSPADAIANRRALRQLEADYKSRKKGPRCASSS